MTYEPYDPKDRQITPRTQAVAWLVFTLLIGTVAVSDALTGVGDTGHDIAAAEVVVEEC
ncbi:MAG: hypothetical protein ACR2RF_10920 [Geminicoccaceae bacterium]